MVDQPAEGPAERPAAVVDQVSDELLRIAGVEGVGVTSGPYGGDAIVVYVRDPSVAARVPLFAGGLPTIVEVTGQIDATLEPDEPTGSPPPRREGSSAHEHPGGGW